MRGNIASGIVQSGNKVKIKKAVKDIVNLCSDYEKFIIGCGVVSYDTDPENILLFKKIVKDIER
jgi:hypothetical protein